MKGYSIFPKAPEEKSHYQMLFSIIFKTLVTEEVLPRCRDAVGAFYSLSRLANSVVIYFE